MGHPSAPFDGSAPSAVAATGAGPRFSAALREATADVHRRAERTGFLADLLRGRAAREGYTLYLRNLVPIYAALEAALDAHLGRDGSGRNGSRGSGTDVPAAFTDTRLRRLPALLADLEALAGARWERTLPVLPQAEAYALAIRAAGHGHRLIAHAYVRVLGDLSGGQILKPLLARFHDVGPEALAFYDFPALADLRTPKVAMREALDAVPPDHEGAIIAEALDAFGHNIAVSEAISAATRREAMAASPA